MLAAAGARTTAGTTLLAAPPRGSLCGRTCLATSAAASKTYLFSMVEELMALGLSMHKNLDRNVVLHDHYLNELEALDELTCQAG